MWTFKGRSGYGDSTIGGDYDSWDGISPNGRQYKNEATMETRNLSGADYWQLRKQNRPTEAIPESLHMLSKGRANIDAYAILDEPVKRKTSVPLKQRILPHLSRVEKLRSETLELESAYRAGEFSLEEYSVYRDVAFAKLQRAEVLYRKAIGTKPLKTVEETEEVSVETTYSNPSPRHIDTPIATPCGVSWIDDLSPSNSFKKILQITCKVVKTSIEWHNRTKAYIQTLKEV